MDLSIRLKILDQLYAVYDEYVRNLNVACRINCAHCCTCNVTLTTLEGYKIVDHFESHGIRNWLQAIKSVSYKKRFQPKTTTNKIAEYCMHGRRLPAEEIQLTGAPCPFLKKDQCPLYEVRPFGCRCMVSKRNCHETGFAEMDAFVITVNTVFLQVIEHLDWQGCSGNLTDILQCLAIDDKRHAYRAASLVCLKWSLIPNQKMKVLMIPPEHRKPIEPIVRALRSITV
jgi:Fe-S-cluster containining protein